MKCGNKVKRAFAAIVCGVSLLLSTAAAYAAQCDVYVNDSIRVSGERTSEGKVRIPVREFFEKIGYTVQWIGESNEVIVYNDDTSIAMFCDQPYLFVDKTMYVMDDTARLEDGVLMMPAIAPVKVLGASVKTENDALYLTCVGITDDSGWGYEAFEIINNIREQNGLNKLSWNSDLASVALYRCRDMVARNYFDHNAPDGTTPFDIFDAFGLNFTVAAENIAAGQSSPQNVVDAWMNSTGHRNNILNASLSEGAVAFIRGGEYGIYWVQEFMTK